MMRWYDDGVGVTGWGAWLLMGVGMVVFWTVVALLLYAALRGLRGDGKGVAAPGPGGEAGAAGTAGTAAAGDARRLLDERLARGDIDAEDYRVRRELLDR